MTALTLTKPTATGRASRQLVAYWVTTVVLASEMLAGGMCGILRIPFAREMVHHLGYPSYFDVLLGVWYALGGLALLSPGLARLKEWAYAGATIVYTGAVVSHLAVDDPLRTLVGPLLFLILTLTSWASRPPSRRLPSHVQTALDSHRVVNR